MPGFPRCQAPSSLVRPAGNGAKEWPPRLLITGPSAMSAGLAGVGVLMAPGSVAALILPIVWKELGWVRLARLFCNAS
jgi:hypothetical protein